jgi:hypothetical protein
VALTGDEVINISRRSLGAFDDYGNATTTRTSIAVANCLIGFGSTNEATDPARNPVDAALTIFLPSGTEVLDGDEFEIRGEMWVKDGDAISYQVDWPGFTPGVSINVRRRRG